MTDIGKADVIIGLDCLNTFLLLLTSKQKQADNVSGPLDEQVIQWYRNDARCLTAWRMFTPHASESSAYTHESAHILMPVRIYSQQCAYTHLFI